MNRFLNHPGNVWAAVMFILFYNPVSGQWIPKNGQSMNGNCFMIHYDQQVLYIGMTAGLFSTPDDGVTWNFTDPGITVLTMARNNNTIFVSDGGTDMRKSTDGGNTWVSGNGNLPSSVNIQCFCFSGPALFMASYDQGVFKTEDNGVTWIQVSTGLPGAGGIYSTINSMISMNSSIFAGTAKGVYKTTDNGATWTQASSGLPVVPASQDPVEISSMAVSGTQIYVTPLNGGVYSSIDMGATWTKFGWGTKNCQIFACNTNLFACTDSYGLYQTKDNGLNWVYIGLQSEHAIQAGCAGSALYAVPADYSSLLVSNDNGSTWNPPGNDLSLDLNTVFINNSVIYTGGLSMNNGSEMPTGIIERSANNGILWNTIPLYWLSDVVGNVVAFAAFGNSLFAGTTPAGWSDNAGGLFRSDDNGITWNFMTIGTGYISAVNCFAVTNNKIFAGTSAGVYSSADGITWTYKALDTHYIHSLCFIGNTLYAGTDAGVFDSPDLGLTWGETGQGTSAFTIYSLCAVKGEIYAGTDYGILHYTDSLGVKFWYPANGGIITSSVISMASYNNYLFAATDDQHVYMTKTAGSSWGDITENLINPIATIMISQYQIYAATYGGGLMTRPLGDFTGIDNAGQPASVSIFPNPAMDLINITLKGVKTNFFRIDLINSIGQIVLSGSYTVQNGMKEVQMDCSAFSPGLFSARIVTGESSIVKKIVIH